MYLRKFMCYICSFIAIAATHLLNENQVVQQLPLDEAMQYFLHAKTLDPNTLDILLTKSIHDKLYQNLTAVIWDAFVVKLGIKPGDIAVEIMSNYCTANYEDLICQQWIMNTFYGVIVNIQNSKYDYSQHECLLNFLQNTVRIITNVNRSRQLQSHDYIRFVSLFTEHKIVIYQFVVDVLSHNQQTKLVSTIFTYFRCMNRNKLKLFAEDDYYWNVTNRMFESILDSSGFFSSSFYDEDSVPLDISALCDSNEIYQLFHPKSFIWKRFNGKIKIKFNHVKQQSGLVRECLNQNGVWHSIIRSRKGYRILWISKNNKTLIQNQMRNKRLLHNPADPDYYSIRSKIHSALFKN